ncbi:uncharacterized protein [Paramisgurnus dabryanus]|uniref:uncharacterized protein n=1 Tax=Paramisgurnus dabryanus TaxID=90735 RepID=UPI003CCFA4EF
MDLFIETSECEADTRINYTELLTSVCSYTSFPCEEKNLHGFQFNVVQSDFLLDLCSHVKDYERQTGRSLLPALQSIYQSSPAVWTINLSERKTSILLEVLKLQTEKKPVELIDCTDDESEKEITETTVKMLLSSVNYEKLDFLLDLCSHVKDYERQTGSSVLPALQSIYQSSPAVWIINLSKRKTSILLEVLKLQTEKKPVELIDSTDDESEVRGFIQCLPYISQLRFVAEPNLLESSELWERRKRLFILDLCLQDALYQKEITDTTMSMLLSSVNYEKCDFLLNLYSRVKKYETQTGRSVLPALQSIYRSSPAVWTINLSKRKTSILLEVLKLQTEKKPVELRHWPDDESEEGFIQCLPYISQLRLTNVFYKIESVSHFLVNLFTAASEFNTNTEEKYTELLTSVCNYATFPCEKEDDDFEYQIEQCDFLLDLYSHVKNYESLTGRSVPPALQSIYQSAPAVWTINLSERKTSILLEVLKLQTEKKPVELIEWTDDESEVRGFIQCLPYISQLRFTHVFYEKRESVVQFLVNLFTATSEFDTNTGEKYTELLKSVCCYTSFPFNKDYFDDFEYLVDQCSFLLDLYSHVKNYESQTGRSLLPTLQSIYQSSPAIWIINLSERKTSILLEVLKLQTEKKPVELIDCTDDESEVRGFIQCLPYISQLRNAEEYIPSLCKVFGPKVNRDEVTPLLQALGFTVTLSEKLPSSTCRCVGRVLSLSSSKLNLTLKLQAISLEGVKLLFRHITHLQTLSLEGSMVMMMVSSLTSLLRRLSVQFLDLTKCKIDAASVTALLCLQGLQTIRLSKETLQQLVSVVYEAQDDELTRCFLKKVSEDLTSCSLTWEVIQYLLQHQPLQLKLDFRKSKITCENIRDLLPWLDRINFKRLTPSFILSIIMEIYESRSPQFVSGLLSSAENDINLKNKVLNSDQCSALCFTLQHCNTVKLNLFWTSIPEEELKRLLPLLNRVTQLSVDRQLLLKLLHRCSSSDDQQEAAKLLLSALQYRLDFSSCSIFDLTVTEENQNYLNLTIKDCKIISSVLQKSQSVVKLVLKDSEVSDSAVKRLLPVLSQVELSCSKALLLQFIACITEDAEKGSLRWVQALLKALGGEVDLSHTQMDQRSCEQLSVFLEYSDGLTELDLSHCRLTDQYMNHLLPHLHKTQTLDLSHNNITDDLAMKIHSVVSTHDNIQIVRLFGNRIRDKQQFTRVKQIEIW